MNIAVNTMVGDGVLNVRKEEGWTSHDVVAKLRGILEKRRIGHAGTLDPAATGVLPVLIGKGTRIAEFLMAWDKEYRAVLRLGETTDTQDATGTLLHTRSTMHIAEKDIVRTIGHFQGTIRQIPPMYSAVKVRGVPLYKAARAGQTVERHAREVTIQELEVLDITGHDVSLRIVCSKGTYIRTLCADIGDVLGVGGHLLSLERTRVGPLLIRDALSLHMVSSGVEEGRLDKHVMSLDQALQSFPALVISGEQALRTIHGVPVPYHSNCIVDEEDFQSANTGDVVRIKSQDGRLLALASKPEIGDEVPKSSLGEPIITLPILKVLVEA